MLRHLKNEEIDYDKWDECIASSPQSRVYAFSWYLDVVSPEWGALILNDYQVIFPLPEKKKWGLKVCLQPLFCQQLGLFSSQFITEKTVNEIQEWLKKHYAAVKVHFNSENPSSSLANKANYILPLAASLGDLQKAYKKNCVRNIKKSKDNSCTLMENLGLKDIMDLFRWQSQDKKMGLKQKDFSVFEHLLNTLISKGALISIGLYSPVNHLCACALFIRDGKRLYYLMGASDQMGHEYRGLYRIFDYTIEQRAGQDLILDFEGSENKGIARFFAGFGAVNRPYPIYSSFRLGPLNSLLRRHFS